MTEITAYLCASGDRGGVSPEEARVPGQELAAELRRSRLVAGMSDNELARRTGLSRSSVSRFENGQVLPSLDEVDHWGQAVGASELVREQLRALTRAAATEVTAIRHALRPGPAAIGEDIGRLETSSAAVRSCQPSAVPGLLQTPEYARLIMGSLERPKADLDAATVARMARQGLDE